MIVGDKAPCLGHLVVNGTRGFFEVGKSAVRSGVLLLSIRPENEPFPDQGQPPLIAHTAGGGLFAADVGPLDQVGVLQFAEAA